MNEPSATPMLDSLIPLIYETAALEKVAISLNNRARVRRLIAKVIRSRFPNAKGKPCQLLQEGHWAHPPLPPLNPLDLMAESFETAYDAELAWISAVLARYLAVRVRSVVLLVISEKASGQRVRRGQSGDLEGLTYEVVRHHLDPVDYPALFDELNLRSYGPGASVVLNARLLSNALLPLVRKAWRVETQKIITDPTLAG